LGFLYKESTGEIWEGKRLAVVKGVVVSLYKRSIGQAKATDGLRDELSVRVSSLSISKVLLDKDEFVQVLLHGFATGEG
jgi:hypothetical protein